MVNEFVFFSFYPRWKDYETMQAELLNFSLDEGQCQRDWAVLLSLASQPGETCMRVKILQKKMVGPQQ